MDARATLRQPAEGKARVGLSDRETNQHQAAIESHEKRINKAVFALYGVDGLPGTYSQILPHIVFSTRHREPWITAEIAERLCPYIGGIVRTEKGVLVDIGGVEDHIHMYLRRRPDATVSDLMRTGKARSSKWIHGTFPALSAFAWQEGCSVFSVSKLKEQAVKKSIAGQAEHHKQEDFKSELLRMLLAHGVEFDERIVFD